MAVKEYWAYRIVFFACIALSIAGVTITIAGRNGGAARGVAQAAARTRDDRLKPKTAPREERSATEAPTPPLLAASDGASQITSRVRVTAVLPFGREVQLFNFGDAAEDLSGWRLVTTHGVEEDVFVFPIGTLLLAGESLSVVIDEGVDLPNELHWRVPGQRRVLSPASDSVLLQDDAGHDVSRFSYARR